uniref:Uncharacterized protein n=1 Tax=Anopheles atroparvus TaxID=41427 RepID=A0AAG5DIS9_ANOAO
VQLSIPDETHSPYSHQSFDRKPAIENGQSEGSACVNVSLRVSPQHDQHAEKGGPAVDRPRGRDRGCVFCGGKTINHFGKSAPSYRRHPTVFDHRRAHRL